MLSKNMYSLLIKDDEEIEFEALISFDEEHGKYFRVLLDEYEYEDMIRELIYNGYKGTKKIDEEIISDGDNSFIKDVWEDYTIEVNSIDELKDFLSKKGFECEVIKSEDYDLITSVSAEGQDIGYDVISNSNKIKISNFTQSLYKAANRTDYEPIELDMAGSYKIELYDTKEKNDVKIELIAILEDINNRNINTDLFWNSEYYYSCIRNLTSLSKINHLDFLFIEVGEKNYKIFKDDIKKISRKVQSVLTSKPFSSKSTEENPPRAFDYKNLSFKLDTEAGVRYAKVEDEDLFYKIKDNTLKELDYSGRYRNGVKSVLIEKVTIK